MPEGPARLWEVLSDPLNLEMLSVQHWVAIKVIGEV